MIDRVLTKIFGTQHERDIKKLLPRVEAINALEPSMKALSNEALRAKTDDFRARLAAALDGVPEEELEAARNGALDEMLEEAFAVVRETSVRRPRDAAVRRSVDQGRGPSTRADLGDEDGRRKDARRDHARVPQRSAGGASTSSPSTTYLARRDADWMGKILQVPPA
jgi:preprotein translocase subunit SecA